MAIKFKEHKSALATITHEQLTDGLHRLEQERTDRLAQAAEKIFERGLVVMPTPVEIEAVSAPKFDRAAYQREYMRDYMKSYRRRQKERKGEK